MIPNVDVPHGLYHFDMWLEDHPKHEKILCWTIRNEKNELLKWGRTFIFVEIGGNCLVTGIRGLHASASDVLLPNNDRDDRGDQSGRDKGGRDGGRGRKRSRGPGSSGHSPPLRKNVRFDLPSDSGNDSTKTQDIADNSHGSASNAEVGLAGQQTGTPGTEQDDPPMAGLSELDSEMGITSQQPNPGQTSSATPNRTRGRFVAHKTSSKASSKKGSVQSYLDDIADE